MGKTALGGDIVVCGDLSYNSLIESEDSVSQQQSLFLLDRFNFIILHPNVSSGADITSIAQAQLGTNASQQEIDVFENQLNYATTQSIATGLSQIMEYSVNGVQKIASIATINNVDRYEMSYTGTPESQNLFIIGITVNKDDYLSELANVKEENRDIVTEALLLVSILGLIGIVVLMILACYMSRRIIRPIAQISDRIYNLMTSDEVTRDEPSYSYEINTIYKTIKEAKTTLNFANNGFLKVNDTEALLDFAEAYTLFKKANNRFAMVTCMNNIGVIHFREGRYDLAADSFSETIVLNAEILAYDENGERLEKPQEYKDLSILDQVISGFRLYKLGLSLYFKAKTDSKRVDQDWEIARKYLKKARKRIEEFNVFQDYIILIEIAIADSFVSQKKQLLGDQELFKAEQRMTDLETGTTELGRKQERFGIVVIPLPILRARVLLQQAKHAIEVNQLKEACVLIISSLTIGPIYSPVAREEALDLLKAVVEPFGGLSSEINCMRSDFHPRSKDVVFLFNYSQQMLKNGAITKAQRIIQYMFQDKIKPGDRISLFKFTKNVHKTFSLVQKKQNTAQLRNQFQSLKLPYGREAALYKALKEALIEFNSNFNRKNSQWIIIFTCCDNISRSTDPQLYNDLIHTLTVSKIGLIIIGINLQGQHATIRRMNQLADCTQLSVFVEDPSLQMIDLIFKAISPVQQQAHQMVMEKMF